MPLEIHYNVFGSFRPPGEDIDLARDAVTAGFDGIWIGDHFLPWLDSRPYAHHSLALLGSLMEAVPKVPVGTSVTCPTMRYHPPVLTQALATLDNAYPDRLEFGVGVGEAVNDAHFYDGDWPDWGQRAGMLIEAIQLMRALWESEEYHSHDGKYYQYEDIRLATRPRSDLRFHWAGWGPQSCRCAGKYAGNILTVAPPAFIRDELMPPFEEGLRDGDHDPDAADVTTEFTVNVGDPAELVAEVRDRGEYVPDETELDTPDPRVIQEVADRRLGEKSDDEIIEEYRMTRDAGRVIDDLEALEAAGVTRVLVGSVCGDPRDTIALFEDEVFPHFA
ncbi:LLM class flavin-dependent oxidoreductase [Haloarchaeobius sp. TZWSO28]|uniref:LLM class flavin-dependent oxidoreductase n=1 Tax=Haloarchaeobius sp. TZWSO28 TaxID=3446119 RepID=UPI003EB80C59